MIPSSRSPRSSEAGATLVEMLVVLAILAVVAGIAWPMHARFLSGRILPSTTDRLVSILQSVRAEAIRSGREAIVSMHIGQRVVVTEGRPTQQIPPDVAITLITSRAENRGGAVSSIRFHPDGRSSGAEILLEHRGRTSRIIVERSIGGIRVVAQ